MAARAATARSPQKVQRELEDLQLVLKARNGDSVAMDALIRRYTGFVRLKASSYFLAGGDNDDLLQEGLIGLYKAVRDFRSDKETSFRSFAELCVTRQIITAIKTATRFKHAPLNTYVSFSHTPAGEDGEGECTLGDALPGPAVHEPPLVVISTEELQSLVFNLGSGLSPLEADAQPTSMADVRGNVEPFGLRFDECGLHPQGGSAYERVATVAVMAVPDSGEGTFAADEERRLAVRQPLARLGQSKAELAHGGDDLPLRQVRILLGCNNAASTRGSSSNSRALRT
jgi:RNA polymerase sporulation-specific sigma factor